MLALWDPEPPPPPPPLARPKPPLASIKSTSTKSDPAAADTWPHRPLRLAMGRFIALRPDDGPPACEADMGTGNGYAAPPPVCTLNRSRTVRVCALCHWDQSEGVTVGGCGGCGPGVSLIHRDGVVEDAVPPVVHALRGCEAGAAVTAAEAVRGRPLRAAAVVDDAAAFLDAALTFLEAPASAAAGVACGTPKRLNTRPAAVVVGIMCPCGGPAADSETMGEKTRRTSALPRCQSIIHRSTDAPVGYGRSTGVRGRGALLARDVRPVRDRT